MNPKHQTINPKPQTPKPKPTPKPQPLNSKPQPQTPKPEPQNPKHETLHQVWLFSEGFASFSVSFEITAYAILDVCMKYLPLSLPLPPSLSLGSRGSGPGFSLPLIGRRVLGCRV